MADDRIKLIAADLSLHFLKFYKEQQFGLKAQLATDSKRSAIRYKKHLDEWVINSAVVMSAPDTRSHKKVEDEDT